MPRMAVKATVADDLRADLDQLLLQARQRPVLTWGGLGQGGRIRVTSADLQYLFGIRGLSPIA